MANMLDVKYINPFLKATIMIFESLGLPNAKPGKLALSDLSFPENTYIIQVGITGEMKGQVLLGMSDVRAKEIASIMMMGMPVNELDEIACSALGELGNMILGNTATIFSTMDTIFDITPPLSMYGKKIKLQSDIPAVAIPVMLNDKEYITLHICVKENK